MIRRCRELTKGSLLLYEETNREMMMRVTVPARNDSPSADSSAMLRGMEAGYKCRCGATGSTRSASALYDRLTSKGVTPPKRHLDSSIVPRELFEGGIRISY
jgi:hypothetical protein